MQFKSLASSSRGNCYLVEDHETTIMLECGLAWREVRERMKFNTTSLDAVVITHEHGDHAKGVCGAIRAGIDCYMSKGTAIALNASGHRVKRAVNQQAFSVGSLMILPFTSVHDAAEPLCYLIAGHNGDKLLFLTDTAYCKYKFNGITHLVIECNFSNGILLESSSNQSMKMRVADSHMSLERVVEFITVNDMSCLKEVHLIHLSDTNSDEALFKETIQKIVGVPVYVCPA